MLIQEMNLTIIHDFSASETHLTLLLISNQLCLQNIFLMENGKLVAFALKSAV